jgi:curved DNA-binding protein CbpA
MSHSASSDPFQVLGVSRDAGEAEVRARYLELVKQYPPEREPEKFREVRAAYEAAKDPLSIARRLVAPPDDDVPQWSAVLEAQKRNPPRLSPAFLLSLGNRAGDDPAVSPRPPRESGLHDASGGQNRMSPGNETDAL